MSNKNNVIKSELLSLFNKGKSEKEAYDEIYKSHGSHLVTLSLVSKWFEAFKSGEDTKGTKKKEKKPKATDKFIINLVSENPDLNLKELAKLAKDTKKKEQKSKLTNEFIINLVNENPDLNLSELAKLANTSAQTISTRLKQINTDEEVVKYRLKTNNSGAKRLSEEFIINLVNENPGLNMTELAKLASTSPQNLSRRLKKINIDGESAYFRVNADKMGAKLLTDELLIKTINENPDLNIEELAKLTNTTYGIISYRMKRINRDGDKVKYIKKDWSKFSNESLIDLINSNPDLNMKELSELTGTRPETISRRVKKMNHDGKLTNYSKKGTQNGATKFSDEFLINLIKDNPGLNMCELSKLAGASQPTISNRLRQINSNRSDDDKIVLQKKSSKPKKGKTTITDEYLAKLISDNPDLNIAELAEIADTTFYTIYKKLKEVKNNGDTINYKPKKKKFTDEFLINLINENPELNMRELAKIAGCAPTTVLNRINRINSDKQVVNYHKKELVHRDRAFTDEFLINLVNDNPELTMKELAKLANVTTTTISNRLKELNMNGERVVYTIKSRASNSKSAKN